MRYFFDIPDLKVPADRLGREFATASEARKHATCFLGDTLRGDPDLPWEGRELRVEVTRSDGAAVFTLMVATFGPLDDPAVLGQVTLDHPRRVWVDDGHVFVERIDGSVVSMTAETAVNLSRQLGTAGSTAVINRVMDKGPRDAGDPPADG